MNVNIQKASGGYVALVNNDPQSLEVFTDFEAVIEKIYTTFGIERPQNDVPKTQ